MGLFDKWRYGKKAQAAGLTVAQYKEYLQYQSEMEVSLQQYKQWLNEGHGLSLRRYLDEQKKKKTGTAAPAPKEKKAGTAAPAPKEEKAGTAVPAQKEKKAGTAVPVQNERREKPVSREKTVTTAKESDSVPHATESRLTGYVEDDEREEDLSDLS